MVLETSALGRQTGDSSPKGHQQGALLASAAEDSSREVLRILDDISAAEKAAHAMSEEDPGKTGKSLIQSVMEAFHIPDYSIPTIRFRKKSPILFPTYTLSVPQVVVGEGSDPLGSQKLHECIISLLVLRHPMGNLDPADHPSLRKEAPYMDFGCLVSR